MQRPYPLIRGGLFFLLLICKLIYHIMEIKDCFYLGKVVKPFSFKGDLVLFFDVDEPEEYSELDGVYIEINKALFNATREFQNQDKKINTTHNSAVRSIVFDPLCNNIASNSSDGQILVFNSTDILKLNTTFIKQNNILI